MGKESIRKLVNSINNPEENGGLWLPNIQRYFVWNEDQIERLFDSLMRSYPINNLLIWKTNEDIKTRKFIDLYKESINFNNLYLPNDNRTRRLVLDGQQRLQSFYIALKGSYNNKELYFNILSGNNSDHKNKREDTVYEFEFLETTKNTDSKFAIHNKFWIRVKDIIFKKWQTTEIHNLANNILENYDGLDKTDKINLIVNNLTILKDSITNENVDLTELDSIDDPDLYSLEDIVEIFIRANSGGTQLSKSDLLFTLLTSGYEEIEENLNSFLEQLNGNTFNFNRDFILKICLILIDSGAKYEISKFRNLANIKKIEDQWPEIKKAILDIKDFITNNSYIRSSKALPSQNALIPLIYYRYKYFTNWKKSNKSELVYWLLRMLLTGAFSGSSDAILDKCVDQIKKSEEFIIADIYKVIENSNRSIYVTEDSILSTSYGQSKIYLIFSLLYNNPNFDPVYNNNLPSEDHIFSQSTLKGIKVVNSETNRSVLKYSKWERDRLPNLMLLSIGENRDDKKAMTPENWFSKKDKAYWDLHYIPNDKNLLKTENFEEFIAARSQLIINKLKQIKIIQ